jgi:hypothetical protein
MFGYLDDPIDENTWRDDVLRIDVAALDEFLRLHDRRLCRHAHQRTEVACRLVVQQVAERVADLALDQCKVRLEPRLHDISAAIELAGLLALGQYGVDRRRRIERGHACAGCADAFGQCALRHDVEFDLARTVQLWEHPGLAGAWK